jgi:pyrroloquinoline quinone (PQQ) biosynthesis protein C
MTHLHWRVARTPQEVERAQRLCWRCYGERLGIAVPEAELGRLDAGAAGDRRGVHHHVVVYAGDVLVGTARLSLPDPDLAAATDTELGFELEREVRLGELAGLGARLAEVSRLCIIGERPRAAVQLYAGAYALSRALGVQAWIGGVDCQTRCLAQARRIHARLERLGLLSDRFRVEARLGDVDGRQGAAPAVVPHLPRPTYGAKGAEQARRLPRALNAFTRRLGARCVGLPVPHPALPRVILPMHVELDQIPAATLAAFEALEQPALGVRSAPARAAPRAYCRASGGAQHGLSESVRRVARQGVERLDRHPVGASLVAGTLTRGEYIRYLSEVVHQLRQSSPMLELAGRRLNASGRAALAALFLRKAREEDGHDEWALSDLAALGVEREAALSIQPSDAVLAYARWLRLTAEHAPYGVLGLAYVLEWFGHTRAELAASNLIRHSHIPNIGQAVRFLRGHGEADGAHVSALDAALAQITQPAEVALTLRCARMTVTHYLGLLDAAAHDAPPGRASPGATLSL